MTSSPRLVGLDRQSRDYLLTALTSAPADSSGASAAFQSGYFALLSALSADEVSQLSDHPNAKAAALAAQRLQLVPADQVLAADGAAAYYSPNPQFGHVVGVVAWARRVRAAVRWTTV